MWPLPLHSQNRTRPARQLRAVAFTMKQYVQTDLEADRQVANTLAELIIGGQLFSAETTRGQEA